MRAKIIPSAPFASYREIESLAVKARGEVKRIQIDVCDGEYVPSVSWPFTEFSKSDFETLKNKKDLDVFLPEWETMNYSVDLMVLNPEKYIETFAMYGVDEIVIHFRSLQYGGPSSVVGESVQWNDIVELAKTYELNLVLATDVKTDWDEFLKFAKKNLENINGFQVMGIEKIGFQGQEFDDRSLDLVEGIAKELVGKDDSKEIYFDGAINEETAEDIKKAGVDVFCVGSYLTQASDFVENLQILKNLVK